MAKIRVEEAGPIHAILMAPVARDEDRAEFLATDGLETADSLLRCLELSTDAWAAYIEDDLVGLFGVMPRSVLSSEGVPWFISSKYITEHPIIFLRACRKYVKIMLGKYASLESFVDARYGKAIQWLRWMGFEVHEPEPFGILNLPFHKFNMRRT